MKGRLLTAAIGIAGIAGMTHGAPQTPAEAPPGKALFVEKCAMCHGARGMGTLLLGRRMPASEAPLETRTDLTADYVIQAARGGIGNMPRIPRGEVTDRQLDAIAAYLAKAPGR